MVKGEKKKKDFQNFRKYMVYIYEIKVIYGYHQFYVQQIQL